MAHDAPQGARPALLREALEIVRAAPPGPTVLMLDAKDEEPWPRPVVETIARLIEPVRDRIFVGTPADWNLRRLRAVDPDVTITFDPMYYLERKGSSGPVPGRTGAYGYRDDHPLAFRRSVPVAEYLRERITGLARRVPGISELHIRLALFEQMQDDGLDVCAVVHEAGARVDVWTLDAGTPQWQDRLRRALDTGVDIVTTNTPRALSEAASAVPA